MNKTGFIFNFIMIFSIITLIGCNNIAMDKGSGEGLQQIKEVQGFSALNGYKVKEGKFYFTGIKDREWYFNTLDLEKVYIKENQNHQEAENYDLYIPLGEEAAVYVDVKGQLFYRRDSQEKRIDEGIMGIHRPNLLVSPNQNGILYTKGAKENADLYAYFFQQDKPILIKRGIPQEAFITFSFTTQWSYTGNYFLYYNTEVYDNKGILYTTIEATTAQWSPDDKYIVYIKKPHNLRQQQIQIGDWKTYIGTQMLLLSIEEKKDRIIYEDTTGLIDPIDNIQWSKDASKVSIAVGEITKTPYGELEKVDYNKIFVYNLLQQDSTEVKNMPYNYHEILFNNYIYASSLGKRDILEIVSIDGGDRRKYENPKLLNGQDMFVISHNREAYFLDKQNLMMFTSQGQEKVIIQLPWEVSEVYFDTKTRKFIFINKDRNIYLLKHQ